MNQLLLEGHRATVDWGKRDYPAGTPGQIVGITYFATTRNEFDARFQAHEDYEPAIPDVTVLLETPGPDGVPNTDDDVVVNKYVTDHWQQPNASQDPQPDGNTFTQNCNPIRDFNGADITSQFNPDIGPNCLEVPLDRRSRPRTARSTAATRSPTTAPSGYDLAADDGTCVGGTDPVPLVAGDYIVHVDHAEGPDRHAPLQPGGRGRPSASPTPHGAVPGGGDGLPLSHRARGGRQRRPRQPVRAADPAAAVHRRRPRDRPVDAGRRAASTYGSRRARTRRCATSTWSCSQNGQNANADFNLMTNFRTDPNGTDATDTRTGDVAEPGRAGRPGLQRHLLRAQPEVAVVRRAAADRRHPGRHLRPRRHGVRHRLPEPSHAQRQRAVRRATTGGCSRRSTRAPDGSYEALVPSTETLNCPIPQGPCPGMYIVIVDDPGTKAHPNANYNPNLLTANTPSEVWPGLTTQLDTPLDPISGTACEDPAGRHDARPVGPGTARAAAGLAPVVAPTRARPADHDPGRLHRHRRCRPARPAGGSTLTDVRTGAVTT